MWVFVKGWSDKGRIILGTKQVGGALRGSLFKGYTIQKDPYDHPEPK
jgi:hypothetical protein